MLRSKAEVENHIREKKRPDSVEEGWGFWMEVVCDFFPLDELQALGVGLKEGVDPAKMVDAPEALAPAKPYTEEAVLAELTRYMVFAWGKVEDHRGISAGRSVEKIATLVWLLLRDDVLVQMRDASYAQYGAPKLAVACRAFSLPIPEDNGIPNMIEGEPCTPGCEEGCGS